MPSMIRRVRQLADLLATRPKEFIDRLVSLTDRFTDRRQAPVTPPLASGLLWPRLSEALETDVSLILGEEALSQTDAFLAEQIAALPPDGPFGVGNSAERLLGHTAYVVCRAVRPDTVVETGVAYGSMTTYLLAALKVNNHGALHSIDLPSIEDRDARFVGRFVPERLRDRWSLHLGASRRLLPKVLEAIGPVGLFVHDSLHTRRNMSREFTTVTPYLAPRAAVVSDDVHWNRAFEDWARNAAARWAMVRQVERDGWLGFATIQRHVSLPHR
jgi:hypothetical protein